MQRASGRAYSYTASVLGTLAPNATITVYNTGTLTKSTIYGSNSTGDPKSNPFTSDQFGYWFFYAADGGYDVQVSGTGLTTYTTGDIWLATPGALPTYTSGTLPAAGTAGDAAFETDTKLTVVDTGTSWQAVGGLLPSYANASLPASPLAGSIARQTDGAEGVVVANGSNIWFPLNAKWVNGMEFGIIPDGSTDNTTALTNALTAAAGSTLILPAGTINVAPTSAFAPAGETIIQGAGMNATAIVMTGSTSGLSIFRAGNTANPTADRITFKDLSIKINGNNQVGIEVDGSSEAYYQGVRVYSAVSGNGTGMLIHSNTSGTGSYAGRLIACQFEGLAIGVQQGRYTDTNPGANVWTFTGCKFTSNGTGWYGQYCNQVLLAGCWFESNTSYGVQVDSNGSASVSALCVLNSYFESNTTAHVDGGSGRTEQSQLIGNIFIGGSITNWFNTTKNNILIGGYPGSTGYALLFDGSGTSKLNTDGTVSLPNLPTSDPGSSGALYVSAGVVKQSP